MADFNSINQGIDVTNKILDTADYKKWLSLIMTLVIILVFILALIWLTKKVGGNFLGDLWDFFTTPFRRIGDKFNAQQETGTTPDLTSAKAKNIADDLENCFHYDGDDEEGCFNILRNRISNAADWYLVKAEFGTRRCRHAIYDPHSGGLEHIIAHNFGSKDRAKVRTILQSKGITTSI